MTVRNAGLRSVTVFRESVRDLYASVGAPPYRRLMSRLAEPSGRATVSDLVTGKTVPKWETVETFVKACRIHASRSGLVLPDQRFDLLDWRARYDRMRSTFDEESGGPPLSEAPLRWSIGRSRHA